MHDLRGSILHKEFWAIDEYLKTFKELWTKIGGVAAFIHTLGTWKKSSIHLVCPWGQVSSQGVVT
jgi:hypothetical protein